MPSSYFVLFGRVRKTPPRGLFGLILTKRRCLVHIHKYKLARKAEVGWGHIDYVHEDDRVALICDGDRSTAWDCYRHYRGIKDADIEIRKKIVSLGFANDEYFPALQAADMLAYLSRLEAKRRFYRDHYTFPRLFDYLTKERGADKTVWRQLFADEAMIRNLSNVFSRPLKRL